MKALSYTTDLLIAGIILVGVVGLVVYAEGFLTSQWEDIYKLKIVASDAAYYLAHDMKALRDSFTCDSVMSTVVPSHLNYIVYLDGEEICSKGDLSKAQKVASSIAYGVMWTGNLVQDIYYYKSCHAEKDGFPIYRCALNSPYTREQLTNPTDEDSGIILEGLIEVRVFV